MLTVIFGYTVVLHLALPVIAVFLKTQSDPQYLDTMQVDVANMISTEQIALILYGVAVMLLVIALKIPKAILSKTMSALTPGTALPVEKILVPYLVRICLFESISVVGLAIAIMTQQPLTMLPMTVVGLGGTLLMPPNADFFRRFAG